MRALTGFVVWSLVSFTGIHGQQVDRAHLEGLFIESFRYLLEVRFESKYSSPVIGGIRFSDEVSAEISADPKELTAVVSQRMGIPVWGGPTEKFCDVTGSRPYWRMKSADVRVSGFLKEVSDRTALVSLSYSAGSYLAGTTSRTLRLERNGEGWSAVGFEGGTLHGSSTGCRPTPPSSMSPDELVAMLSTAIVESVIGSPMFPLRVPVQPVFVASTMAGWVEDLESAWREALAQRGFLVVEDWKDYGPVGDSIWGNGLRPSAAGVLLHHVVFEGPNRVKVQIGVTGHRPSSRSPRDVTSLLQECLMERNAGVWEQASCDEVEFSMKYPSVLGTG